MELRMESLYPDATDEIAKAKKAKKPMLNDAATELVNMLSCCTLIRLIVGIADDIADIIR